jgi:[ribosomal protein S5]-alanine N-acetyltransferase
MMRMLQTARLLLRDFVPTDWDAVEAMLSDPEVTRYMHFGSWDASRRRRWFDWCVANNARPGHDPDNWAITLKATGACIGWLGIGGTSRATVQGERSFGYALAWQYWNQGYMTEALRAVLTLEFGTYATTRIGASCDVANPASARVMAKAGMRHELTSYDADGEGNWAHRHHYAIDIADWMARTSAVAQNDPLAREDCGGPH